MCLKSIHTAVHITVPLEFKILQAKKLYTINSNFGQSKSVPKVILVSRTIARNNKILSSYYSSYFCTRKLEIDATHTLKIEIDEPHKCDNKAEILILQNRESIEEYLFGTVEQYAITRNAETFHVFRNGSWNFWSEAGIRIKYLFSREMYSFSVNGSYNQIMEIHVIEILERVKTFIHELQSYVE